MPKVQFPCLKVQLVQASLVVANDYNPNSVASAEMELLKRSIQADGLTQPIVVFHDQEHGRYIVVDGFHRFRVLVEDFDCDQIPVVVIEKTLDERIASTIRHNRARGKHQVDLMAEIVRKLMAEGLDDAQIAKQLGMSADELLRLKQSVGVAPLLAGTEYSCAWGESDVEDPAFR